jgi:hypothetical protein
MQKLNIEYHNLHDEAFAFVKAGRLQEAESKLQEEISKRKHCMDTFFNGTHAGHIYFLEKFLPKLISIIRNSQNVVEKWEAAHCNLSH